MITRWYWFGALVDTAGHVKLRQYHVVELDSGVCCGYAWSKGISGKLWYVRMVARGGFEQCKQACRAHASHWSAAYFEIDQGIPPQAEQAPRRDEPQGAADPCWWAVVLGVDCDADKKAVRGAYRRRVMETHPDATGADTAQEFIKVQSAWEYVKALKNW